MFTVLRGAENQLFSLVQVLWFPSASGLLLWFYLAVLGF